MKYIYDYIIEYAKNNPKKPALVDVNGTITYDELEKRSGSIAFKLRSLGLTNGDVVGVYVPYVKEIALGGISIVRAGCVYMPMDNSYPKDRLKFMIEDSKTKAILTVHNLWDEFPLSFPNEKVVFMDDRIDLPSYTVEGISIDTDAFILYTSGTTGRPKGVVHSHQMMVSFLKWATIHKGTEVVENSKTAVMTGFTFIGSTEMLYSALCKGATTYVVPEIARKDLKILYDFLCKEEITHIFMPSSLAATFVEYYDTEKFCIFAGGEKMRNFNPISKNTCLINSYGATELAGVISLRVHGDEDVIPTGKLAFDTEYMLWDENEKEIIDEEAGELLVSNERMSHRYLNLLDQTASHWIKRNGKIWFRTGDRAKRTKEGIFTILGRTDNMIKLRGFRIETGEVEAQINTALLNTKSEAKNAVVVLRTINGIDHLTCFYEGEKEIDKELVKKIISNSLASYMIPDIWVRMDAMPRNANGKIIRAELPQPKNHISEIGKINNEAEAKVVDIVASVLGIDSYISPDDGFVALGGTSIKATEFSLELRNVGINIGSAEILKFDKLRVIAEKAEIKYELFWSIDEYERIKLDFASRNEHIEKVLPISAEQDEALFELLINPDKVGSRHLFMFQIDSILDEKDLRKALDIVSMEFEYLRSAIVYHKVMVIQQVITNRKIPIEMIELPDSNLKELKNIYYSLSKKYCDLQKESSVQIVCVHMGSESFLFMLDFMAGINMLRTRKYITRVMDLLSNVYSNDKSIIEWKKLFEIVIEDKKDKKTEKSIKNLLIEKNKKTEVKDIFIYSEKPKKKIFFVHTGNAGSEAYYNLAKRIKNDFSFAVIEPFNLYNPSKAKYGIKNIAARYIETIKKYQKEGPYIIGGWCYGGIVAHEMACQLQKAGDKVEYLILFDAQVTVDEKTKKMAKAMVRDADKNYFETADLFKDMRERGMLDALVENSRHVTYDMIEHIPSYYDGSCIYFKPDVIPLRATGGARKYWEYMKDEYDAGGYENYCNKKYLKIIETPHEHDLMMDDDSLDIIVPNIYKIFNIGNL